MTDAPRCAACGSCDVAREAPNVLALRAPTDRRRSCGVRLTATLGRSSIVAVAQGLAGMALVFALYLATADLKALSTIVRGFAALALVSVVYLWATKGVLRGMGLKRWQGPQR